MKLSEVIPWGRSFDEYRRMFALADGDLAGRVLGCGDGPASFNAEAAARGHAVVSYDPIYAFSASETERRFNDSYGTVISQVKRNADGFLWDRFRDPDHLGECRLAAMKRFLADFERGKGQGRYVAASLPDLPFESMLPFLEKKLGRPLTPEEVEAKRQTAPSIVVSGEQARGMAASLPGYPQVDGPKE